MKGATLNSLWGLFWEMGFKSLAGGDSITENGEKCKTMGIMGKLINEIDIPSSGPLLY